MPPGDLIFIAFLLALVGWQLGSGKIHSGNRYGRAFATRREQPKAYWVMVAVEVTFTLFYAVHEWRITHHL